MNSYVNPGSKAANKGIREGDIITSINNQSTRDLTNSDAHVLLKRSGDNLKLGLNEDCEGSPKRRQYKIVQQESHSESIEQATLLYFERYFDHQQPSLSTFKNLYKNLGEYGTYSKPKRSSSSINEAAEINILGCVIQNRLTSTRQIAIDTDTSQRLCVRVLKEHGFCPYKLLVLQALHEGHHGKRIKIMCRQDPQFQFKDFSTDETQFVNCVMFNRLLRT
ncbi:hypothetical protein FQA39_LY16046 [Lamprigera yunnana]|nr:hypothetical protein FQA39_LY16046 [Lamprigera yunnana]